MEESPYDYLFIGKLRHWGVYQAIAEMWEVTKDGKLIHHDNPQWKFTGYELKNGKLIKY